MIETLVQKRVKQRGTQKLTVIDPNSRIRNGLPILDLAAEMDYYKILDPYGKSKNTISTITSEVNLRKILWWKCGCHVILH